MFMAFNNGIAATAEEVTITDLLNNQEKAIPQVKDFQIVNGRQTTASVYHNWKKVKIENILASSPNFFDKVSEVSKMPEAKSNNKISSDLLKKMVVWDTKAKVLSAKELQYIADFAYGLKSLNDFHKKNIRRHISRLQDAGFTP